MSRNLLALVIALPSLLLLLARLGLFAREKYFQIGLRGKSQAVGTLEMADIAPEQPTQQVAYASRNPDRAIQNAIDSLLKEDHFEMLRLVEKAFHKQPELWPVLRREIAQLPPDALSQETVQQKWSTQSEVLQRKTVPDDDDLELCCTILIWCVWYLHIATGPLPAAGAWEAMGKAYQAIANILPARTADCGRSAFYSFQRALTLYRQLANTHDTLEKQIDILCLMGQVRAYGIEKEIDRTACYFSCLDCFAQAQALYTRNPALASKHLVPIYTGLTDTCKSLYDELPGEVEWSQRAQAAYSELQALYRVDETHNEQSGR